MPVELWFTSTGPAHWKGLVITKTRKRQIQRLEADARNNGLTTQLLRSNPRREQPVCRLPVVLMRHNNEAGGSVVPPQKETPKTQSVVVKPAEEAVRLELKARLKALEARVRHSQEVPENLQEAEERVKRDLGRVAHRERWPLRDDEEIPTPSSTKVEAEGKKPQTDTMSVDEDAVGIDMVYVLPMSFRATTP